MIGKVYITVWCCYNLKGDENPKAPFVGKNIEIKINTFYHYK